MTNWYIKNFENQDDLKDFVNKNEITVFKFAVRDRPNFHTEYILMYKD